MRKKKKKEKLEKLNFLGIIKRKGIVVWKNGKIEGKM